MTLNLPVTLTLDLIRTLNLTQIYDPMRLDSELQSVNNFRI